MARIVDNQGEEEVRTMTLGDIGGTLFGVLLALMSIAILSTKITVIRLGDKPEKGEGEDERQ